jgi:hypothetical protein
MTATLSMTAAHFLSEAPGNRLSQGFCPVSQRVKSRATALPRPSSSASTSLLWGGRDAEMFLYFVNSADIGEKPGLLGFEMGNPLERAKQVRKTDRLH